MNTDSGGASVDAVVIGAGLSGLVAARRLARAGRSVLVLEAEAEPGGRVRRGTLRGGHPVDLGAQWAGPTHERLLALADSLGVTQCKAHVGGAAVLLIGGRRAHLDGPFPPFGDTSPGSPLDGLDDARNAWNQMEAIAASIEPAAPWKAPGARELDTETLESWIARTTTTEFGRFMMENFALIGGMGPYRPDEVSVLHQAWGQRVSPQGESPESLLFDGGAASITERLAGILGDHRVRVSTPVTAVAQDAGGVTVTTPGTCVRAKYAIVAIPPPQAAQVRFDPAPPAGRALLMSGMAMGTVIKMHAVYRAAFWRDDGLSGGAASDLAAAPFAADSSPPGGRPGILTTFIAGRDARLMAAQPSGTRRATMVAALTRLFGPAAAAPDEVMEAVWPSPGHPGGGFTTHLPPGLWTTHGHTLRSRFGRIHWAGTEVATAWPGFLEGAVRAGEAAAAAVLAAAAGETIAPAGG